MAEPIELRGVRKAFGDLVVLDGVDLSLRAGRTTAIIGPSGTGKSVMLKLIVGLLTPDQGQVEVCGVDMAHATRAQRYDVRRRLGMLFQDGALFDSLSVGDNIAFPLVHHHPELGERERRSKVDAMLERVGLPGLYDRPTPALSGGQRKRVGLARAIITEPEIVLFDEPNSGLDPMTSDAIDELIVQMKESLGITFVVISHDIVGTVRVADDIGMLYGGRLIEYGPTPTFVRSENTVVRAFLARNLP